MMTLQEIRAFRQAQVHQYQQSGQSIGVWCDTHQVNIHTLHYWLSKLSKSKTNLKQVPSVPWLALSSVMASPVEESVAITLRIGEAILSIIPGYDPLLLRQVLQVLQGL